MDDAPDRFKDTWRSTRGVRPRCADHRITLPIVV